MCVRVCACVQMYISLLSDQYLYLCTNTLYFLFAFELIKKTSYSTKNLYFILCLLKRQVTTIYLYFILCLLKRQVTTINLYFILCLFKKARYHAIFVFCFLFFCVVHLSCNVY